MSRLCFAAQSNLEAVRSRTAPPGAPDDEQGVPAGEIAGAVSVATAVATRHIHGLHFLAAADRGMTRLCVLGTRTLLREI